MVSVQSEYITIYYRCHLFNVNVDNRDIVVWFVHFIGLDIFDRMHNFQAREDATENGVLLIKPRGSIGCDKKLRPIGVRASISHAYGVRTSARQQESARLGSHKIWGRCAPIMFEVIRKFVFELSAPY